MEIEALIAPQITYYIRAAIDAAEGIRPYKEEKLPWTIVARAACFTYFVIAAFGKRLAHSNQTITSKLTYSNVHARYSVCMGMWSEQALLCRLALPTIYELYWWSGFKWKPTQSHVKKNISSRRKFYFFSYFLSHFGCIVLHCNILRTLAWLIV